MRVIGKFDEGRLVNALVDSLRNIGLDRKDMIISNIAEDEKFDSLDGEARETILIKNERDALGETNSFTSGINELQGNEGIVVAVECPKKFASRVQGIMEQNGAVEVFKD